MKRLVSVLLAAIMLLTLCSCTKKPEELVVKCAGQRVNSVEYILGTDYQPEDYVFSALLKPDDAEGVIHWETTDRTVIKLTELGNGSCYVTLGEPGAAKIIASCGDLEKSVEVTVTAAVAQPASTGESGQMQSPAVFETAPPPSPAPTPTIESIRITYYTKDLTDSEFTMRLADGEGGDVTLKAAAYPLTITVDKYIWSVDYEGVVELTTNADGTECLVHQVGTIAGAVKITVEACGVSASTRVYCME